MLCSMASVVYFDCFAFYTEELRRISDGKKKGINKVVSYDSAPVSSCERLLLLMVVGLCVQLSACWVVFGW